jgi:hypothetical protein
LRSFGKTTGPSGGGVFEEGILLRKAYTGIRLDKPDEITGDQKYWFPFVRVRPGKNHSFLRSPLLAIVDTGASYCLFHSDIAEAIGIRDITTGKAREIGSVKQGVKDRVYFHKIKLQIESDWNLDILAGFSPNLSCKALLGRYGFLDHFIVTFDHSGSQPMLEILKIDMPC